MRGRFDYESMGPMDATHLRWFTSKTLHTLLPACGFIIDGEAGTVGEWHEVYSTRLPWTMIPPKYRFSVLRRLVDRFPGAFALQHIIRARVA
jgi:hypothetical protein